MNEAKKHYAKKQKEAAEERERQRKLWQQAQNEAREY